MEQNIKVSVLMITYGHEDFIARAIEGVLMQECPFNIELIIANDKSPDNTDKIVNNIIKTHPRGSRINYFFHKENLGIVENFQFCFNKARGEYIAICEGDDYWGDKKKLHKQVEFLEENPEYVVTFHDVQQIDSSGNIVRDGMLSERHKKDKDKIELQRGVYLWTLTMCFRNYITHFPKEMFDVLNADTFLMSLLGNYGKAKYMSNIAPASYRVHQGGVWGGLSKEKWSEHQIITFKKLRDYYIRVDNYELGEYYLLKLRNAHLSLLEHALSKGKYGKAYNHFKQIQKTGNYSLKTYWLTGKSIIKGLI